MKLFRKKHLAKSIIFAMLLLTVAECTPIKKAAAADLSPYLNMDFGIKYSGETIATANEEETVWNIEYFNVADSSFKEGDEFYISCEISGAWHFKQIAIQSSANNWNWNTSPKKWSNDGFADTAIVAGKVTATQNGDKLSFKMRFDNAIGVPREEVSITLTDLYIMKIGNKYDIARELPEDMQLKLGTSYDGTVTATYNNGIYETKLFNVNDSAYSAGDTYIISCSLSGASNFKQGAIQSNLNDWNWSTSPKAWAGNGLAEGQSVTGGFTSEEPGNSISFKVRMDIPINSAKLPNSIDLTLTNLIVIKVANNDTLPLPNFMVINKERNYSGVVEAVKDEDMGVWNVQYFNVNNSEIATREQIKISFEVSGAKAFKQLAVQSNVNDWSWDEAPKIWAPNGIPDGTTFSAIITATENCDIISFKLWFDNPVKEDFNSTPVAMTLENLSVNDVH
ncbi:MAG: hypothetical protein J1F22_08830 [Lachnospiraceae bacterium]|nr:hypothetical protein [Lachnospiraceae bacterium]